MKDHPRSAFWAPQPRRRIRPPFGFDHDGKPIPIAGLHGNPVPWTLDRSAYAEKPSRLRARQRLYARQRAQAHREDSLASKEILTCLDSIDRFAAYEIDLNGEITYGEVHGAWEKMVSLDISHIGYQAFWERVSGVNRTAVDKKGGKKRNGRFSLKRRMLILRWLRENRLEEFRQILRELPKQRPHRLSKLYRALDSLVPREASEF